MYDCSARLQPRAITCIVYRGHASQAKHAPFSPPSRGQPARVPSSNMSPSRDLKLRRAAADGALMLNLQPFVLASPVTAGNKLLLLAFSQPSRGHCRQCAHKLPQERQVPTRRLEAPPSAVGQIRSLRPTRKLGASGVHLWRGSLRILKGLLTLFPPAAPSNHFEMMGMSTCMPPFASGTLAGHSPHSKLLHKRHRRKRACTPFCF